MDGTTASAKETGVQNGKLAGQEVTVDGVNASSENVSVHLVTTTDSQQTMPTTLYTAPSDNTGNYFLVRLMHPKVSVPLLVLSGEPDKVSVSDEVRVAVNGQMGLNASRLQVDTQNVQPLTSNSTSVITLQQSASQQPQHLKPHEKVLNKEGTELQSSNKKDVDNECTEPAEIIVLTQSAIDINDVEKLHEVTGAKLAHSLKEKHPPGEKLFICEMEGCGRSFSSIGYLRYHQAVHDGQKSLKCPYEGCDRKFSWPAHLKYHQMTHTGDRRFKCTIPDCGKTFYTPQRLSVHLRTHTGERPFLCGEPGCDKSFTTAGNLKNHTRVHTGERPYVCIHHDCGRQFAEYSSLKKHKLTHTGEKPYTCDICGRTFSQSGSRKVHMRGHMKIRPNKKHKRQKSADSSKQNVVVLRQEDILQYQDFQGSESVVFSQAVGDHVVTVTTQPAEGETDQLGLHPEILGVEEVLTSEECIQGDTLCGSTTMGANVVVLSQPQEIVSMSTGFTAGDRSTREEVVYGSDLLHSDLDHEEIAPNINQPGMSEEQAISHHSPVRGTDQEVGMDPMMETDDESESENQVWVEND